MVGSNSWWFASVGAFYNGIATQSARFADGNNKYLQRTDSTTPTSTQKFTFSCWIKKWSNTTGDTIFGSDKVLDFLHVNDATEALDSCVKNFEIVNKIVL